MSKVKKLFVVLMIAVISRALCLLLGIPILPMVISAVMYAVFYDKLVFFGLRFISALVHLAIWLGLDMTCFALIYALDDSQEKKHGMIRLDDTLQIGLCIWVGMVVLSLFFIILKKSAQKSYDKAENEQMIKEIMQRNTESNFKEKNDV